MIDEPQNNSTEMHTMTHAIEIMQYINSVLILTQIERCFVVHRFHYFCFTNWSTDWINSQNLHPDYLYVAKTAVYYSKYSFSSNQATGNVFSTEYTIYCKFKIYLELVPVVKL